MFLSWVIPAYNEEHRIEKTIREVAASLRAKNFPGGFEIIISNSASRDRTAEIVRDLQSSVPELSLLDLENRGKGWAVRHGMLKARGAVRLFSDADNSVSPDHLDRFLPFLCPDGSERNEKCFDIVIGSIEIPGAEIRENAQWYRRMLGKLAKYVIRAVSGLWTIHDSQRGFKVFTRRAAEVVFPRQTLTGWGFDFEILLIGKLHGLKIREVPVCWINPPDSKVSIGAYATTFLELLRVKRNKIKGLYQ